MRKLLFFIPVILASCNDMPRRSIVIDCTQNKIELISKDVYISTVKILKYNDTIFIQNYKERPQSVKINFDQYTVEKGNIYSIGIMCHDKDSNQVYFLHDLRKDCTIDTAYTVGRI